MLGIDGKNQGTLTSMGNSWKLTFEVGFETMDWGHIFGLRGFKTVFKANISSHL
jgi:hypothetical protein